MATNSEIERTGLKIVVPEKMSLRTAIENLQRREKYEEEDTQIQETFEGFIWDAALSFNKAMAQMFGWATAEPIPGFFESTPPKLISVETGPGETSNVPWGRFSLPGIVGWVQTGGTQNNEGRVCFQATCLVKRKHEEQMKKLFELTRELLSRDSIYKGKAFKLRMKDDDGNNQSLPMPKFLNLSRVKPEELIFSDDVQDAISTSVFTVIENIEACRQYKVPLKRGVLVYGPYGTGKTLMANVAAKKCTERGWTFLYCERADELADMVKLAHFYQPAAVFCEDIDRAITGERSVAMDDILNIIDGIESKGTELMVILTTNHVENINKALLRPGRLDAVINVLPPDAGAVEKLLRIYGRGLIPDNADLSRVGKLLAGTIPAVIRECAERAKLSQIKLGVEEKGRKMILTPEALIDAAKGMQNQLELLKEGKAEPGLNEKLGATLAEVVKSGVNHEHVIERILDKVSDIHDQTC
jgi:transitional endoplasmic reticulum ATPase